MEEPRLFSSEPAKNTQSYTHLPVNQIVVDDKEVPLPSTQSLEDNPVLNDPNFNDDVIYDADEVMKTEPLFDDNYPIIFQDHIPSDDHDIDSFSNN